MFTPEDMDSLYHYMMWNDLEFEKATDGPNHRRLIKSLLIEKKSTGLIREALIAKHLGLIHNTKMHSTTDGITTFDAVHPVTNICYEIKAEQHTTNNIDRKSQNGQLSGTGVFSTIVDEASFTKLKTENPMIAHGMFLDGRLLLLVTFRLSDTKGIDRIEKYFRGNSKTEPRYSYQDWVNHPELKIEYVSPNWPDDVSKKYRTEFMTRAGLIQPNTSLPKKRSARLSKNRPNEQSATTYIEFLEKFGIQVSRDTQPTSLSVIS